MAGKRLLDAALVLSATRNVAKQHVRIRREQFDVWSQTSTIAKAVQSQTDRVTLTAQAAAAIAQRLNEQAPSPSDFVTQAQRAGSGDGIPQRESVDHSGTDHAQREGLKQDHHYKRSEQNAAQDPPPVAEQPVTQEKPQRAPAPDGSIPPAGAPVDVRDSPVAPSGDVTERVAVPPKKEPLEHESAELKPASAKETTIPDPDLQQTTEVPQQDAQPAQDEVPEGVNTDVFHSPRVKRILGGKGAGVKPGADLPLNESKPRTVEQGKQADGTDQDTYNTRMDAASSSRQGNEDIHDLAADLAKEQPSMEPQAPETSGNPPPSQPEPQPEHTPYQMRSSRVPSSRFGRLWQYAGLGTSMAFGAVGESFRRVAGGSAGGSPVLSPANMERLVARLSRMRGAALKLGQMISFQDIKMLPAPIHEVLQRVQDNADYMPASQRDQVLASNLGAEWRGLFSSFEDVPMAAASIGQVHKATMADTGKTVAVKIQYPGVATSIDSDLNNLSVLLTASRLLPRGLFLDKTIQNARTELAWETDYTREASFQSRFSDLLAEDTAFTVPAIVKEASGPQVLTAEFMSGTAVTKPSLNLSQEERDWIGTQILRLCLRELTEFGLMQTDPNWTNFLYSRERSYGQLELLDFGAAREYPPQFVDPYVSVLLAAARGNRETIRRLSIRLGYLTGKEGKSMVDAHVGSVLTLAEPFMDSQERDAVYDFRDQTITDRVRGFIPVMVRERLAPPPEETYSLHRKLSGAFLLLARLGSRVRCRELFVNATDGWKRRTGKSQPWWATEEY